MFDLFMDLPLVDSIEAYIGAGTISVVWDEWVRQLEDGFCSTLVDLLFLMTDDEHDFDSATFDELWLVTYNYWRVI